MKTLLHGYYDRHGWLSYTSPLGVKLALDVYGPIIKMNRPPWTQQLFIGSGIQSGNTVTATFLVNQGGYHYFQVYQPTSTGLNHRFGLVRGKIHRHQCGATGSLCLKPPLLQPVGAGTFTKVPAPDASGTDAKGMVVTLTATPNLGYVFTGWQGVTSDANSGTVTMSSARTVTALFDRDPMFVSGLKREIYTQINGSTIADLSSAAKFSNAPDWVDRIPTLESQNLPINPNNLYRNSQSKDASH